jgi:hypothetical protein
MDAPPRAADPQSKRTDLISYQNDGEGFTADARKTGKRE